jgi:hypothetical protein
MSLSRCTRQLAFAAIMVIGAGAVSPLLAQGSSGNRTCSAAMNPARTGHFLLRQVRGWCSPAANNAGQLARLAAVLTAMAFTVSLGAFRPMTKEL